VEYPLPGPNISTQPDPNANRVRVAVLSVFACGLSLLLVPSGIYFLLAAEEGFPWGGMLLIVAVLIAPAFLALWCFAARRRRGARGVQW